MVIQTKMVTYYFNWYEWLFKYGSYKYDFKNFN